MKSRSPLSPLFTAQPAWRHHGDAAPLVGDLDVAFRAATHHHPLAVDLPGDARQTSGFDVEEPAGQGISRVSPR